jgi:hypothetical protein
MGFHIHKSVYEPDLLGHSCFAGGRGARGALCDFAKMAETGARLAGQSARRSYSALEVMARNSIRHLPSESAK